MILIYMDLGVSKNTFWALISFIQCNFPHMSYKLTDSRSIISDLKKAKVLFIPGGADRFYCQKLNGNKNQAIKTFVDNGGVYVGICAGAYYACSSIEFIGQDYLINQMRELSFFCGKAIGSIAQLTNGHFFSEYSNAKAVVRLSNGANYYYHGGCYFKGMHNKERTIYYQSIMQPAVVYGNYGRGAFLLSGVHFEITKERYQRFTFEKKFIDTEQEESLMLALPKQDHDDIIAILTDLFTFANSRQ